MVLAQYLSTTVYRYYIKKFVTKILPTFVRRSAIILTVDMRNPKTESQIGMRNPKTLSNVGMRNPKTLTEADMEIREEI